MDTLAPGSWTVQSSAKTTFNFLKVQTMLLKNELRQWLSSALNNSSHSRNRRRGNRMSVESLESRTLLTTYSVLNLNDAGGGSLRQAVIDANANAGADEITFLVSLVGAGGQSRKHR